MAKTENNCPRIGCAGWTIPAQYADQFAAAGTHLQKYASRFSAVEINSSFYQLHRRQTYERWAESVPADFRFSAKIPKEITHRLRLQNATTALDEFLETVAGLGTKLAVLLVQLPPSLQLDGDIAETFFSALHQRSSCSIVCEPRHSSWFGAIGLALLKACGVGLVQADPSPVERDEFAVNPAAPIYYRLHGSPKVYYSRYSLDYLRSLATTLATQPNAWCIFDNTAQRWATQNAFELQQLLGSGATHE